MNQEVFLFEDYPACVKLKIEKLIRSGYKIVSIASTAKADNIHMISSIVLAEK